MNRAGGTTLLSVFASFAVGGSQVRFTAVANRFGSRYRHLIVAMDGARAACQRLAPNLDVEYPAISVQRGATFANFRPFRRALRALRPDVLITHNWGSIDWAIANLPGLVRHVHLEDGFGPEERDNQLPRRVLTRRLVLRRATVVLPSRTLEGLARDLWRLPPARLRYIPNGIDLARLDVARDPGRFPGEGPVIGAVAALRPEKALDRLVRAFAALDAFAARDAMPARLVIVGDGPERPGLERLAVALGIAGRVHFTGHIADPAPLYGGFDVFALSSDTEQMPLTVIEAMAAGLPVAATDVGDVRTMVAPENACFVGPKEPAALARSLAALLAGAELRARLGAANRAKAARDFDQEAMFAAYAALFDGAPAAVARADRQAAPPIRGWRGSCATSRGSRAPIRLPRLPAAPRRRSAASRSGGTRARRAARARRGSRRRPNRCRRGAASPRCRRRSPRWSPIGPRSSAPARRSRAPRRAPSPRQPASRPGAARRPRPGPADASVARAARRRPIAARSAAPAAVPRCCALPRR